MKWNDINKTPLPSLLPIDVMGDFYILLYMHDKFNYTPQIKLINHIDKSHVMDDNFVITHWMSIRNPHNDNTD